MPESQNNGVRDEVHLAEEVGELVHARRTELRMTQVQLAERARMTQPQLSRLEVGGVVPTLPVLVRLARALDSDLIITLAPRAGRDAGAEGAAR
ncbi:helix-turn-helix domain-containing protein [Streptomyces sp. NBC_01304]|uniref:helix-turn-helix domain-containing protein n=1 Tax=Streptomyces sp. NBC_01304 TaxID=2903818 RepID=UPI002E0FA96F|nr:helix-turn-helix domain-containing protein [Streptomyces sp. NBC_01304]